MGELSLRTNLDKKHLNLEKENPIKVFDSFSLKPPIHEVSLEKIKFNFQISWNCRWLCGKI